MIDPDFAPCLFNLAILREGAGAYLEAIDLYRHVITVDPSTAEPHLNLAFALRSVGQEAEAQAEHNRALDLDTFDKPVWPTSMLGNGPPVWGAVDVHQCRLGDWGMD